MARPNTPSHRKAIKEDTMTTEEWETLITEVRYQNAFFANMHIDKDIEVKQESEEIVLLPSPIKKGHLCYIPF